MEKRRVQACWALMVLSMKMLVPQRLPEEALVVLSMKMMVPPRLLEEVTP